MHFSQFASNVTCQHCFKQHSADSWPMNGDRVPFYFSKEEGRYNLKLLCPNCGKDSYVVWDQDPGTITME